MNMKIYLSTQDLSTEQRVARKRVGKKQTHLWTYAAGVDVSIFI